MERLWLRPRLLDCDCRHTLVIGGVDKAKTFEIMAAGAVNVILGTIFFFAGRSLAKSGANRGLAWPWVTLSLMQTVPFVFFHAYVLPTGSMENTLLVGDHLLVRQVPKPRLHDGDLVVFRYPVDPRQIFTKRVIGMAGDRITIASRVVYRNGVRLAEPYVIRSFPQEDRWRDNFPLNLAEFPHVLDERSAAAVQSMLQKDVQQGQLIVPSGKYFVLGDNRDNSLDSRYWGLVDESDIIGKPVLVYYSPGHLDRLMKLL